MKMWVAKSEDWVVCEDYPSYMINREGQVKSNLTNKILKPARLKTGYMCVGLRKDGKSYTVRLHRLLAKAFIPNIENKPHIDHINGVRDDNRLENLRWCTNKYNSNYGTCRQRIQQSLEREVYQYNKDGSLVQKHSGMTEASRTIGVTQSAIVYATDKYDSKGVIRSIKGYVWKSKPWEEPNDSTLVTTTVIGLGWHNFKYVANTHKLDWNKIVVEQLNPKDIGMRSDTNLKRITMPKFYLNYFGKQWREAFKLKEEGVI